RDDKACFAELQELGERYTATVNELLPGAARVALLDDWSQDARELGDILASIAAVRSAPQSKRDIVAGYGELWSSRLLAACLENGATKQRPVRWLDAREFIVVRPGELGPAVVWHAAQARFDRLLDGFGSGIAVVTGFIAADEEGRQTTLGRNGSDYSAAIVAALAGASELTIWSDVDGVMSGDPNRVPEATIIASLTYNEAMELAYFGAKVLHPQTLGPVIDNDIPIVIRNTFAPDRPGSRIAAVAESGDRIKGITAIDGMALVNLEGTGMIGVPGTADRLFAALKRAGVSVTLISQASSEHSICIAVPENLATQAQRVITEAFAEELDGGQIERVDVTPGQSIIAVVGENMAGSAGLAGRFFGTLGRAGINVRAIAQGSSERNISAVVDAGDATRALRAVHSGFYLSSKTLSIGLIGPGTVGSTLLEQMERRSARLRDEFNLDLRIRAIARSRHMLLGERRIALDSWREQLETAEQAFDQAAFIEHIQADHLPHTVIIDCTSSDAIAGCYADWLARGIHVITPNKKAFSGTHDYYCALQRAAASGNAHYLYETTVGAALPIVSTLRDLLHTGDRVHSIRGILSGTLAYLFNVYDGSRPFSEIVREARDSGFTEPDPRDDLSGMDVARKLTILARELGSTLEIGDFPVQDLVPEKLRDLSADDFLAGLADYDDDIDTLYRNASAEGKVLRYVANLAADGEASVGLQQVGAGDPLTHINLTDNVVQFVTDRYADNPLVVQGPGAGPGVTAGGVFSDLLRLAAILGGNH
ncbi:MAG TPA: bifunctional aspartate kinase/homoserine dehydrogenase I, partial [Woeseiaceae bacterium]|nr:bifunctional aspartate kinase/homoserine dehydrogenase I [Woeseiaceae bacterium]